MATSGTLNAGGTLDEFVAEHVDEPRDPEQAAPDSCILSEDARFELDRRRAEHLADPSSAVPWSVLRASLPKS
jgi:putative addiction module component (TIGR02574 family)